MPPHSPERMQRVLTPMIPVVGQWLSQRPHAISLGQGVVHYPPPPQVADAVAAAANDPHLSRYGPVQGSPSLRAALALKLAQENGLHVDQSQTIMVTAGSNMAFQTAISAIADVDDEIILLSPYYFNHHMATTIAGCRPVVVATNAQWQLDVDAVAAAFTSRTRAVVTISPNNPTGAVYTREALDAINKLCAKHGVFHISDEAYEYFTYDAAQHYSPASRPGAAEHTISLFSFSKGYGMAGWRCGYLVAPDRLEPSLLKIQDTNLICPPQVTQRAAEAALGAGAAWRDVQIAPLADIRRQVLAELSTLEPLCTFARPAGAFYVFLETTRKLDDVQLAKSLLDQYDVAVMPGSTFGIEERCTLRIAYGALDRDTVAEGVHRVVRGLRELLAP
ncbi:MAG: pyridoxal phosphate-dependent aminotransferase [Planctomycetales bacterium]|nr:pyridoxal phosphate-dependent aminotransferase [Planctomycetales bacterium]